MVNPKTPPDNNKLLCNLIRLTAGPTVLVGDFNYSGIDWDTGASDSAAKPFLAATQDKFLTQCVDFPTHDSGNTLDLVLTTNPALVVSVQDVGKLGKSDHKSIFFVTKPLPQTVSNFPTCPRLCKGRLCKATPNHI